MKVRDIAVLGTFDFGKPVGGQQVKTQVVGNELKREFGDNEVRFFDSQGKWKFILRLPVVLFQLLTLHKNIVFMLADKGIRVVVPPMVLLNYIFRRHIHYVVIGGWLPSLVSKHPVLRFFLKKLDGIYVETNLMSSQLQQYGFRNIAVMHNCKEIQIIDKEQLPQFGMPPFPLCTFSRVIKSKGIEDAVIAVNECNKRLGKIVFTLDIYGMIQEKEWFDHLMTKQSSEIRYCGMIDYKDSTEVLHNYFALLFPTYYQGEGFAGTLIDAMAAGVPSIVSDWRFNGEIVTEGKTGFVFPTHSVEDLTNILVRIADTPKDIETMRLCCIEEAHSYLPSEVTKVLKKNIK